VRYSFNAPQSGCALVCRSPSLTIFAARLICVVSPLWSVLLAWVALLWLAAYVVVCLSRRYCLRSCKLEVLVMYSLYFMSIGNHVRTIVCGLHGFAALVACTFLSAIVQDPCRMGVWLGWHICYNVTQVSQGQLRENRNLSSSIRAKAALIYVLSVPVHNVNKYLFGFILTRYV